VTLALAQRPDECHPTGCVGCSPYVFGTRATCTQCTNGFDPLNACWCIEGQFFGFSRRMLLGTIGCYPCMSVCKKCISVNSCASCKIAQATPPTCTTCENGYSYDAPTNSCIQCHNTCTKCTVANQADKCLSCKDGSALGLSVNGIGVCLVKTDYWRDPATGNNYQCPLGCQGCTSDTRCSNCKGLLVKEYPSELCTCRVGAGYFSPTGGVSCEKCGPKCFTCEGTAQNCLVGEQGTYKEAATGLWKCQPGFYEHTDGSCLKCHVSCTSCRTGAANECFQCPATGYVRGTLSAFGTSLCNCAASYVVNPTNQLCELSGAACHDSCYTCATTTPDINKCSSCKINASLAAASPNRCDCNPRYYMRTPEYVCLACHPTCLTCSGDLSTQCLTCGLNADLTASKTCVCRSGSFKLTEGPDCTLCSPSCKECSGTNSYQCTECKAGTAMTNINNGMGECLCPFGQFFNTVANQCQPCGPRCKNCTGSSTFCTECKDAPPVSFLNTATGVCSCTATNKAINSTTGLCENCHVTCLTCSLPGSLSSCSSCVSQATVISSACVCSQLQKYMDRATGQCTTCPNNRCKTCDYNISNVIVCTSCQINAALASSVDCQCNTGFYMDSAGLCQTCPAQCSSCTGPTLAQCTACNSTSYPIFYQAGSGCLDCHSNCARCFGGNTNNCNSCHFSAIYSSTLKTCTCSATKYMSLGACYTCDPKCLTCETTSSNCFSCVPGNVLIGNTCTGCDANCVTCSTTSTNCTSCVSGKVVDPVSKQCVNCYVTCATCTGLSSNNCSTCKTGTTPVTGVCGCPTTSFMNLTTGLCNTCDTNCKTCDGSASSCTSCNNGLYLSGQLCLQCNPSNCLTCSSATYCLSCSPGKTLVNNTCQPCHPSCATCSGPSSTQCSSCQPSATLSSNTCTCASTKYLTTTGECLSCDSNCLTCSLASTTCTSCTAPKILISGLCTGCDSSCLTCAVLPTSCTSCANDKYLNAATCEPCHKNCLTCTGASASHCKSCKALASLPSGQTVGSCTCAAGYFTDGNTGNCLLCDSSCNTCQGSSTSCLSCKAATPILVGSTCNACDSSCLSCVDTTTKCTSCVPGKVLVSNACATCHAHCATCSGVNSNNCSTCKDTANQTLVSQTCVCRTGTFMESTGFCSSCSSSCKTCSSSPSTCTACFDGKYLNSSQCSVCDKECLTCNGGSRTNCLTCKSPTLNIFQTNQCLCIPGHYMNSSTGNCTVCHASCSTCNGGLDNNCLSCPSPLPSPVNGTCSCSAGKYKDPLSTLCTPCHNTCATCDFGGDTACLTCKANAEISGGKCQCKNGFFMNSSTGACDPCHYTCLTCAGPGLDNCTGECTPNAGKYGSRLINGVSNFICECIESFYLTDEGTCSGCHISCRFCTGPLSTDCCKYCRADQDLISLPNDKYICKCQDPNKYLNQGSGLCTWCAFGCQTCSGGLLTECITCWANFTKQDDGSCKSNTPVVLPPNGGGGGGGSGAVNPYIPIFCHVTCFTCSGGAINQCLSCKDSSNAVLTDGTCRCRTTKYMELSTGYCNPCPSLCAECTGPISATVSTPGVPSQCHTCVQDALFLADRTCTCDDTFYAENNMCNPCHKSCRFCTGPYVVQCKDRCKRYAVLQPDNTCKCKDGYYSDQLTGDCLMCFSTCKTCTGPGKYGCEQLNPCTPPAYLQGEECRCASGLYMDAYSGQCIKCDEQCQDCYDSGPMSCRTCSDANAALKETKRGSISEWSCQCKEPYKMNSKNVCFKCNPGAFAQEDNCNPCNRGCKSCRTEGQCDACDKDFFLNKNKQCVSTITSQNCSTSYIQSQIFVKMAEKGSREENGLQMKDIYEQYFVSIVAEDESDKQGVFDLKPIKSDVDWGRSEMRVSIKVKESCEAFKAKIVIAPKEQFESKRVLQASEATDLFSVDFDFPSNWKLSKETENNFGIWFNCFYGVSMITLLFLVFVRPFVAALRNSKQSFWFLHFVVWSQTILLNGFIATYFNGALDRVLFEAADSSFRLFSLKYEFSMVTELDRLVNEYYLGKFTMFESTPNIIQKALVPILLLLVTALLSAALQKCPKLKEPLVHMRLGVSCSFAVQYVFLALVTINAFVNARIFNALTIFGLVISIIVLALVLSDMLLLKAQLRASFPGLTSFALAPSTLGYTPLDHLKTPVPRLLVYLSETDYLLLIAATYAILGRQPIAQLIVLLLIVLPMGLSAWKLEQDFRYLKLALIACLTVFYVLCLAFATQGQGIQLQTVQRLTTAIIVLYLIGLSLLIIIHAMRLVIVLRQLFDCKGQSLASVGSKSTLPVKEADESALLGDKQGCKKEQLLDPQDGEKKDEEVRNNSDVLEGSNKEAKHEKTEELSGTIGPIETSRKGSIMEDKLPLSRVPIVAQEVIEEKPKQSTLPPLMGKIKLGARKPVPAEEVKKDLEAEAEKQLKIEQEEQARILEEARERVKLEEQKRLLREEEERREREESERKEKEDLRLKEDLRIKEEVRIKEELRLKEDLRIKEDLRLKEEEAERRRLEEADRIRKEEEEKAKRDQVMVQPASLENSLAQQIGRKVNLKRKGQPVQNIPLKEENKPEAPKSGKIMIGKKKKVDDSDDEGRDKDFEGLLDEEEGPRGKSKAVEVKKDDWDFGDDSDQPKKFIVPENSGRRTEDVPVWQENGEYTFLDGTKFALTPYHLDETPKAVGDMLEFRDGQQISKKRWPIEENFDEFHLGAKQTENLPVALLDENTFFFADGAKIKRRAQNELPVKVDEKFVYFEDGEKVPRGRYPVPLNFDHEHQKRREAKDIPVGENAEEFIFADGMKTKKRQPRDLPERVEGDNFVFSDGEKVPRSRWPQISDLTGYYQERRNPEDVPVSLVDDYYMFADGTKSKRRDPMELPQRIDEEFVYYPDGERLARRRYPIIEDMSVNPYEKRNPRDVPILEDDEEYCFMDGKRAPKRDPRDVPYKVDSENVYFSDGSKLERSKYPIYDGFEEYHRKRQGFNDMPVSDDGKWYYYLDGTKEPKRDRLDLPVRLDERYVYFKDGSKCPRDRYPVPGDYKDSHLERRQAKDVPVWADDDRYYFGDGQTAKKRDPRDIPVRNDGQLVYFKDGEKVPVARYPLNDDYQLYWIKRRAPENIPVREESGRYVYSDGSTVKKRDPRDLPIFMDRQWVRFKDGEQVDAGRFPVELDYGRYAARAGRDPRDTPVREDMEYFYFHDESKVKKRNPRDLPFDMDDKYYYYGDGEKCLRSRYNRDAELQEYGLQDKKAQWGMAEEEPGLDSARARRDPRDIPVKEDEEYYYYEDDSRVKKRNPRELPFEEAEACVRYADGEEVARGRFLWLQEAEERRLGQYGKKNPRDVPVKEDERLYYFEDGTTIKKRDPRDLPFKEDHKYYYYADGEKALKHRYFRNVQFKKQRFAMPEERRLDAGAKSKARLTLVSSGLMPSESKYDPRYDKNMYRSEAMRMRLEENKSEKVSVVKQFNNDVFGQMDPKKRGMRYRNSTHCLTLANGPSEVYLRSEIFQPVLKPIN
jgi:hypothetical protein